MDTFQAQEPSFNASQTHEHGTDFICELVLQTAAVVNNAKFYGRPGRAGLHASTRGGGGWPQARGGMVTIRFYALRVRHIGALAPNPRRNEAITSDNA